jgi:hypothetical protein
MGQGAWVASVLDTSTFGVNGIDLIPNQKEKITPNDLAAVIVTAEQKESDTIAASLAIVATQKESDTRHCRHRPEARASYNHYCSKGTTYHCPCFY